MKSSSARLLGLAVCISLLSAAVVAQKRPNPNKRPRPAGNSLFTLSNLEGQSVPSSQLTPKTPLLMVFVKKNCASFTKAIKELNYLSNQTRGYMPLAFVFDSDAATAKKMLESARIVGLALVDPGAHTIRSLGAKRSLDMVVVGTDQKVAKVISGVDFGTVQEALKAVYDGGGARIRIKATKFAPDHFSGDPF